MPTPHTPTAPQSDDLARALGEFAAGIQADALPDDLLALVKADILDTLACGLAGSSALAVDTIVAMVEEWAGVAQADMFVFGGRYPAHHAALANAAMCHARDYDDTHDAAILHAGVSVVPAAIAAGQLGSASGADLVAAVAAGLEVICRLGVSIQDDIIETGWIYTSILGYFGATVAAGRAYGLDAAAMTNALGIVYSSVAGNHQVTRDASLMKRLQPALAAQAAVTAVQLSQRGIPGVRNVFEGEDGFFRVYLRNRANPEVVRADLGSRFEALNLSFKPYPCCRDTHAAVDAVLQLRETSGRPASEVRSIRVGVTAPGYQMVCTPEEVRRRPTNIVQAQFSLPYTVAAAWIDGELGMRHFTNEALDRQDVLELTSRVVPHVSEVIDRDWRRFVTPAEVLVEFTDGTSVQSRVDRPKGHPLNPVTYADIIAKAHDCASFAARPIDGHGVGQLAAMVSHLESVPSIDELVALMCPSSPSA